MQLIQMETEVIEKDFINIQNEHTRFSLNTRMEFPNIQDLEKEVKALRKELREKDISLYKTDTLKTLKERKEEYNQMISDYNRTFDQLVVAWQNKMFQGIFVGYSNDEYLNEVIQPLEHKITNANNRDTLLTKIINIQNTVDEIKNDLKNGANFMKVSI